MTATTIAREAWGLDELDADPANLTTVDPLDAYLRHRLVTGQDAYTGPSRVRLPSAIPKGPPTLEEIEAEVRHARQEVARFRREVPLERARLAAMDPAGEVHAVAPLSPVAARHILLDAAERDARVSRSRLTVISGGIDRRESGRDLLTRLGADPSRGRGVTRCPGHEDRHASLSWRLAPDGRALIHCFAGCTFESILAAIA